MREWAHWIERQWRLRLDRLMQCQGTAFEPAGVFNTHPPHTCMPSITRTSQLAVARAVVRLVTPGPASGSAACKRVGQS